MIQWSVMKTAIYPGSFDPATNGHLDLIRRARTLFDKIIVAVAENPSKETLFGLEERIGMLKEMTRGMRGVRVESFSGLLVSFLERRRACAVIRGLRAISDFEYEFQMAMMNRRLSPFFETVFLMPDEKFSFISSSLVKEVARLGGDISRFVPPAVLRILSKKVM